MGAGNPIIRSWDMHLFNPTTFFIDITLDLDEDDDQYFAYIDFNDSLLEILPKELNIEYMSAHKNKTFIDELSGEFRGSAIVLARTSDTMLLTTTDSDNHHLALGCVPNFKFEDYEEEAYDVIDADWYDRRDRLDLWEKKREQYANKQWKKRFKIFHKEAQKILTELHKVYQLSARNGAWMSSQVEPNKIIEP